MKHVTKGIALIEGLIGASAIWGGYGLVTGGAGVPLELLKNTPFSSYFWPGMILIFVIGSTYLLAATLMWKKKKYYQEASAVAGFGLLIWIFTEMYMLGVGHILQIVYFSLGILTLITVMVSLRFEKKGKYA
jgi:hypothetical protein